MVQIMHEIKIGSPEYDRIVQETRAAADQDGWTVADNAMKIAIVGDHGGDRSKASQDALIRERLVKFSEDTDLTYGTVRKRRQVADRWPQEHRRPEKISFRVHEALAYREDRYQIVDQYEHLTLNEATELIGGSTSGRGGKPASTLLSVLTELSEIKRRVRTTFRATVTLGPDDESKEQILSDLADVKTEIEQYEQYLTGMGVDEVIEKIMEGT